jgi:aryl-alcohol dehydrogenase-like predicted oxidoreductase
MNYRILGRTGLKVSEFSLGSWTTYGGSVDEADAIAIIQHAFERGINLFDTADVYVRGAAETVLGKALKTLPREQVVVATKCMGRVWDGPLGAGLSRKHIFDALNQSLTRLQIDYVDLYQLHAPDAATPIEETLRAFEDLVRSGKVRYIGFSNYDKEPALLAQAVSLQRTRGWERFVSSQPRYHLLEPRIESVHMPFCSRHGIGIICYSPLLQGVLTNKYAGMTIPPASRGAGTFKHFLEAEKALTAENVAAASRFADWVERKGIGTPAQIALAWVLRRPEITSAILGATRLDQLVENLKAAEIRLSPSEWAEVERVARGGAPSSKAVRSSHRPRATSRRSSRVGRRQR